jgi:hypothetical protein
MCTGHRTWRIGGCHHVALHRSRAVLPARAGAPSLGGVRVPRRRTPPATGHRWPELGVSVLGARGSKTTATPPWTFASQLGARRPAAAPPDILAPIPTSCPPLVRRLPGPAIGAPETWSDFRDLGTLCKARKRRRGGDVVLVFGGCTRHEPPELTGVIELPKHV